MLISGGLAGLAGTIELTGLSPHRLYQNAPGYGYTAIAVALLGRLHPIGVIFSALLFGVLQAGSEEMQIVAQVPSKLTWVTQATVLLLVLGFSMYEVKRGNGASEKVSRGAGGQGFQARRVGETENQGGKGEE